MSESNPQVIEMSLTKARVSFSECINQVRFRADRIVVTSYGEPKAAIVPIEDLRRLQELDRARVDQPHHIPA
jgi:prevent-host-death family protein